MASTASSVELEIIRTIPALKAFARRFFSNPSDVDDLVQETLLKAFNAIDSFMPGTSMKSWLFTIMRNSHHTNYNKQKRYVVGTENFEHLLPTVGVPQEWHLRLKDVQRVYNSMPIHFREVCDDVMLAGETYDESAAKRGCAVGTIKSRVNRAKKHMADELGDSVSYAAQL